MAKKKSNQLKIIYLSVAIVVALVAIIACMIILLDKDDDSPPVSGTINASQSDSSEIGNIPNNDDSGEITSGDSSSSDSQDDNSEIITVVTKPASEMIDYKSNTLIDLLGGNYSTYGFINGGYTIYNYDVIKSMDFIVAVDEDEKILDEYLSAIIVHSGGNITDRIAVGMTYSEMKELLGDKIQPIEQEEDSAMFAIFMGDNYSATIQFEYSGGKSIQANIFPF